MAAYMVWFVLALILLGAEMLTGTFYFLAVSAGCAAGGVLAWAGQPLTFQLGGAALVTVLACLAVWKLRPRGTLTPAQSLDIGQQVQVLSRLENGQLRVHYRGTQWQAVLQSGDALPEEGQPARALFIVAVNANTLVLSHNAPSSH